MEHRQHQLAERIIEGLNLEDMAAGDFDPDAPLFGEGLGLDSIDALELAVLIERHYGVRIDEGDEGRAAFASLSALDRYIAERT